MSYPDIAALWQKLGLSLLENEPNSTLPVISVPSKDGGPPSVIADSFKIALFLDREYPDTPRVLPPNTVALQAAFVQHVLATTFVAHLRPMILQRVLEKLDERGAEYFTRTRQKWYCPEGVSIKELCPPGSEKYKQQMEKLRAGLNTINGFLLSNGQLEDDAMSPLLENYPSSPLTSSPSGYRHWVMGTDGPTFADFCLGGILVWVRTVGGEGLEGPDGKGGNNDLWKNISTWNGGRWARFAKALEEWETIV